jgi:hypothetical protein
MSPRQSYRPILRSAEDGDSLPAPPVSTLLCGGTARKPACAVVNAAPAPAGSEQRNLFGEAERIAARAATSSTRRQYASIFRAFGDWLEGQLGRPPVVGDLDTDAIATYARHLATSGGRGGCPAATARSATRSTISGSTGHSSTPTG